MQKVLLSGGIISPVLSNIYLHYVLDKWFESKIKQAYNNAGLFRYCDDFIVTADTKSDAESIKSMIADRLFSFSLNLKEKKTHIIPFYHNDSFNIFSFNLRRNSDGSITFTTSAKIAKQCEDTITEIISNNADRSAEDIISNVSEKLGGWYQYYGVTTNSNWTYKIYMQTMEQLYNTLCFNKATAIITEEQLDLLINKSNSLYPYNDLIKL